MFVIKTIYYYYYYYYYYLYERYPEIKDTKRLGEKGKSSL
jgi:hypothetical protein